MNDESIELCGPISRSVTIATEYLAHVIERDVGTKNGQTALYWHLIAVVQKHMKPARVEPAMPLFASSHGEEDQDDIATI